MGRALTIDERARRRARRRNRRAREETPLLAWAGLVEDVTVEEARAEVEAHDRDAAEHWRWMRRGDMDTRWRAEQIRREVALVVGRRRLHSEHKRPAGSHRWVPTAPEYQADWWWRRLQVVAPRLAEAWRPPAGWPDPAARLRERTPGPGWSAVSGGADG